MHRDRKPDTHDIEISEPFRFLTTLRKSGEGRTDVRPDRRLHSAPNAGREVRWHLHGLKCDPRPPRLPHNGRWGGSPHPALRNAVEKAMPDPVPATPEELARAMMQEPPKGKWRHLEKTEEGGLG